MACMRFFLITLMLIGVFPLYSSDMHFPWVVYYSDKAPDSAFKPYNPIVLDSEFHPDINPLLADKKEVLGYLNLTEAEEYRLWFKQLKDMGVLIRKNPDWPDSWLIDIRNPKWKKLLLSEIIPSIFVQGFSGLCFDQIDNATLLEDEDPKKYKGMVAAAVDLIATIRSHFPGKRLMMNRGFEIIEYVGNSIDYIMAETLYTNYDFKTKKYMINPDYEEQLALINAGRKMFPHLVVFTLEYWDPADVKMYQKIYALERAQCLRPYVTTIGLNKITPEP